MKVVNPTKESVASRIVLLAEFEYYDHHSLFDTKESYLKHLISRFDKMKFHNNEIALFQSKGRFQTYLTTLLKRVVDAHWGHKVETSAPKRKYVTRNEVRRQKLRVDDDPDDQVDTTPDITSYGLDFKLTSLNATINPNFELNWGKYSSVSSLTDGSYRMDSDYVAYVIKNPQESWMIQWNAGRLKHPALLSDNKTQLSTPHKDAMLNFKKAAVETFAIPSQSKVTELENYYLFVESGIAGTRFDLGVVINFILYDKGAKEQIGACSVGFSHTAFNDYLLEKETGAMIDMFEISSKYSGEGHGMEFLNMVIEYLKNEHGVNKLFVVGVLPAKWDEGDTPDAMRFWRRLGMKGSLNYPIDMLSMSI